MGIKVNPITGGIIFDRTSDIWRDPVADMSALPTTGNSFNDIRVALDTGVLYQWNGAAWVAITPDVDTVYKQESFTLSLTDIANKYVTLLDTPAEASSASMQVKGGPNQFYGDDFTVTGPQLSWDGLALDGILEAGDEIVVEYL